MLWRTSRGSCGAASSVAFLGACVDAPESPAAHSSSDARRTDPTSSQPPDDSRCLALHPIRNKGMIIIVHTR